MNENQFISELEKALAPLPSSVEGMNTLLTDVKPVSRAMGGLT